MRGGQFKNQHNRVTASNIVLITVELEKFTKTAEQCVSDLDKLLYTMKVLSEEHVGNLTTQYPDFWTEEWLQTAIQELDLRAMSPEKRLAYEMTLAANAQAIQEEQRKVEESRIEGREEGLAEGLAKGRAEAEAKNEAEKYALKKETVRQLLVRKFPDEEIAAIMGETLEFIQRVRAEIAEEEAEGERK